MPLNLDAIGAVAGPVETRWSSAETLLYALGVGAGAGDPVRELAFTTENSRGVEQLVLPTFALTFAGQGPVDLSALGSFDPASMVHGEQYLEVLEPLGPSGRVELTGRIADIVDRRSGALVTIENTATDPVTGAVVLRARTGVFIRGEGGFADDKPRPAPAAPVASAEPPSRAPDHAVTYQTAPNQALLYRLCGDRNPLHSDPAFAARGGYPRPILHGLCTYGFTGRALLHTLCGSDPRRFRSMSARFVNPVLPGQALVVEIWVDPDGGGATFRTTADGLTVLGRGRCEIA